MNVRIDNNVVALRQREDRGGPVAQQPDRKEGRNYALLLTFGSIFLVVFGGFLAGFALVMG